MSFPLVRFLRFVAVAFRDFVFPPVCLGCSERETAGELVCPECLDALARSPLPTASWQDSRIAHNRALGFYRPPFSSLVHELKYRNRRSLARPLGRALGQLLLSDALLKRADLLVAVPLHPARRRERGFNQSELIAEQVSLHCGIPVVPALRRVRNTRTQTRLDEAARRKNLAGAFALLPGAEVNDRVVVLIDDVATTGATLNSAAQVLLAAGAKAVYGLTVVRAG